METLIINTSGNAIEEQWNARQNGNNGMQSNTFDPKIYLDTKLEKGVNEKIVRIRILPVSSTDSNIFLRLKTHSLKVDHEVAKNGFKSFICLNDEHVGSKEKYACPICNKAQELFDKAKEYRDKGDTNLSLTLFKQACSYKYKYTYIVRVIDRDHEDEGVKFWRFNENSKGEGCYDKLMAIYNTRREQKPDGTYYNIFDLMEGKDIVLTIKRTFDTKGNDTGKTSINITDGNFAKPLSQSIEQANAWINDPKKWSDAYRIKDKDYMAIVADGKIPVKDRESGKYVAKDVMQAEQSKQEAEQAAMAQQILSEHNDISVVSPHNSVETAPQYSVQMAASNNNDEEPLPF